MFSEEAEAAILSRRRFISTRLLFHFPPTDRAALSITDCLLLIDAWPQGQLCSKERQKKRFSGAVGRWSTWRTQSWAYLWCLIDSAADHLTQKEEVWVKAGYLADRGWYCDGRDCGCSAVDCKLNRPPELRHKQALPVCDNSGGIVCEWNVIFHHTELFKNFVLRRRRSERWWRLSPAASQEKFISDRADEGWNGKWFLEMETRGKGLYLFTLHGSQGIAADEGLVHPCAYSHHCVPEMWTNTAGQTVHIHLCELISYTHSEAKVCSFLQKTQQTFLQMHLYKLELRITLKSVRWKVSSSKEHRNRSWLVHKVMDQII